MMDREPGWQDELVVLVFCTACVGAGLTIMTVILWLDMIAR